MNNLKAGITLFRFNLSSIILFEIMFKLISVAVLAPIVYLVLNFSIDIAGLDTLYTSTAALYFTKPSTYGCLFLIVVILSMFFQINICGIIEAMDASKKEERTNPLAMLFKGLYNAVRVLRPKNIGIICYIVGILPVTFSVIISGSLFGIQLPEFFKRYIQNNNKCVIILLLGYLVICVFATFRIFALNYFTIYKYRLRKSVKLGKKVMKRHAIPFMLGVVFLNIALLIIMFLLETVFSLAAAGVLSSFVKSKAVSFVIDIVAEIIFFAVYITFSIVSTPLIYSYVSASFYHYEEECKDELVADARDARISELDDVDKEKRHKKTRFNNGIAYGILLVLGIVINGFYIYLSMTDRVELDIYYSNRAKVTAHRGDSSNAPENTMAAINLAMYNQADIIEIDVRQTKDGVLVLLHDESLLRTTGVDRYVGSVSYDYVKTLSASHKYLKEHKKDSLVSYINEEGQEEQVSPNVYADVQIPTLEEVLAFAKENDLFLNIELKPERYYENYEENVLALLEKYEFVDDCVVASSNYRTLEQVENLNPDVTTIYILYSMYGNFKDLDYVDGYSVRHSFVTKELVKSIHKSHKVIYAWTVNNQYDIKRLLLLDVDSIITDKPFATKEIIYNANESLFTDWLGRLIEGY